MFVSLKSPLLRVSLIVTSVLLTTTACKNKSAADHPGRPAYLANCAGCHGENLVGQFGKPLTGEAFRAAWQGKGPALRAQIAKTMPPSGAGELPAKVYDDITAYLLDANGIGDAGAAALPPKTSKTEIPGPMPAILESVDNRDAPYRAIMAARAARLAALSPVSEAMLRNPPPGDWLSYRRTDDAQGFSPLHQIDRNNASRLTLAWAGSLASGTNGITPLVHDGVIFVNSNGTVTAMDAITGDTLWSFARPVKIVAVGPPVSQPAGMAIAGERLFVPTNDHHMIALDIHTGKVIWDHDVAGFHKTLKMSAAPLIVHNKLIQGMSGCAGGGEPGGCFIVALDVVTGKELWRFNTIARPGTKDGESWNAAPFNQRFGGSVWATGSYDSGTGLVYFGTGQTYHVAPLMAPTPKSRRDTAALYTDTTLALNPDTGRLVWYYQHLPRDIWDLDFAFERTLTTMKIGGKTRRVVMTMGKMALMDILDAQTGQYLGSRDLGQQNIVIAIDPKTGWKTTNPALEPMLGKASLICPHAVGARNRGATSFDPGSGLLYVPIFKGCMTHLYTPGGEFDVNWGMQLPRNPDGNFGEVIALDVASGTKRWVKGHRTSESSAALATAGGILFEGGRDYSFRTSNSATGAVLWETRLSSSPSAAPVTFLAGGIQYVAITTGGGNPHDATVSLLTPELEPGKSGTMLWVFRVGAT
jgi:alcohol dehydrogenase (cytochrome c)